METLTPRQLEILALYGNGLRAPEVAKSCFISERTVSTTIENARKRTGADTTPQLLVQAIASEQLILDHEGRVRVPELASA